MRKLRALWLRLQGVLGLGQAEQEINAELESHLAMHVEDNLRAGMSPQEARRKALLQLGGVEQAKQAYRDRGTLPYIETLLQDLRFALRQLRKSPGFTLTAVLTLAVGIGGVTAVFSIVETVLLRPLPFQDPGRLVSLHEGLSGDFEGALPAPDILEFARENRTFSGLGGFVSAQYELTGAGLPLHARAERVTASLFPLLGVAPGIGRLFTQSEDDNSAPVAILSYGLWHERFHGEPGIVGRTVDLDRRPYTIVGVMPRDFEFPLESGRLSQRDLWVPMSLTPEEKQDETDNFQYGAIARLKPGVTLQQSQDDLHRMVALIQAQIPPQDGLHLTSRVASLQEEAVASARPLLRILLAAVLLVLGIACVNLANLLLVRGAGRRREFGVRLALGAGRRAMLRQLLTESLLLSAIGGFVGVVLAVLVVRLSAAFLPSSLPRVAEISVRWPVLALAVALVGVVGVVCGLAPAIAGMRTPVLGSLRDGGQSTGSGHGQHNLRSTLVVLETALALLLLVGSGLLLHSFAKMLETDPGFDPEHVLIAHLSLPQRDYPTQDKVTLFYKEVVRRLSRVPQVAAAGASSNVPVVGLNSDRAFVPAGYVPENGRPFGSASNYLVLGDYLRAMRIPLLRGRYFSSADEQPDAPLTAIISQSLAQHYWPNQNPVGRRLKFGGNPHSPWPYFTIVGVVGNIRQGSLDQKIYPQIYELLSQLNRQFGPKSVEIMGGRPHSTGYLIVKTAGDPAALARSMEKTVHQLDPLIALEDVQTMDTVVASTEAPRRFNTLTLTAFASVALLLSLLGIYGVLAYSVGERAREIAIRMALGATRESVLGSVLRSALRLAMVGILAGLAASFWLSRFLESLLYGVKPLDTAAFGGAVVLLLISAALAGWLPARRAASIDPMQTLRAE